MAVGILNWNMQTADRNFKKKCEPGLKMTPHLLLQSRQRTVLHASGELQNEIGLSVCVNKWLTFFSKQEHAEWQNRSSNYLDEVMDTLNMLGKYIAKKDFKKNFWDHVKKKAECLGEPYSALHTSNTVATPAPRSPAARTVEVDTEDNDDEVVLCPTVQEKRRTSS